MTGVSSSNILNLQVTGVASAAARQDTTLFVHTLRLASSSQVNAAYEVSVHDASLSYDSLSQELSTAVESGQFDTYLSTYGAQTGAVGFVGATSTAVTTDNEESGDGNDDKNGFTSGEIAGIVIGSVAVLLVLFTCGYFLGKHRTAQRSPSMVPPAGNRNNIPSLVSPNRNSNSNMEEGGATTTNPLATAKK